MFVRRRENKRHDRFSRQSAADRGLPTLKTIRMRATTLVNTDDSKIFERQARICKAFAHPGRLKLLDLLADGERSVSDLQRVL